MAIASSQLIGHILPIWAGICFASIGIAYQMAATRKVTPRRIFLLMAICGTVFFAFRCCALGWADLSIRALVLGLAAGISQYISVRLVGRAMRLGPFSLAWCMVALNFSPVVLYAAIIQHIHQPWTQWLAVAIAVLCCILAALGHGSTSNTVASTRAKLSYGLLLIALLFINALPNIGIQELNTSSASASLDLFFFGMYSSIAVISFLDALLHHELALTFRRGWIPGLLAGAGSVVGMISLGAASGRSGPAAFLISSMVTLILPMFSAILVFHERATLRWIATLVLGLIAIALANF